jgi:hypothetical protein
MEKNYPKGTKGKGMEGRVYEVNRNKFPLRDKSEKYVI